MTQLELPLGFPSDTHRPYVIIGQYAVQRTGAWQSETDMLLIQSSDWLNDAGTLHAAYLTREDLRRRDLQRIVPPEKIHIPTTAKPLPLYDA